MHRDLGDGRRKDVGVPQLHHVATRVAEFDHADADVLPTRMGEHQIVPTSQHELKSRGLLPGRAADGCGPRLGRSKGVKLGQRNRAVAILIGGTEQAGIQVVREERAA